MDQLPPPRNVPPDAPQWPRASGGPAPIRSPLRRRVTVMLVAAIVISLVAVLQWGLLAATDNPSSSSIMVPCLETFAAGCSWFAFVATRRASARISPG